MISEEDALSLARRAAEERGWSWTEPFHITPVRAYAIPGRVTYEVRTNALSRGNNLRIVIDATDGTVLEAHRLPR